MHSWRLQPSTHDPRLSAFADGCHLCRVRFGMPTLRLSSDLKRLCIAGCPIAKHRLKMEVNMYEYSAPKTMSEHLVWHGPGIANSRGQHVRLSACGLLEPCTAASAKQVLQAVTRRHSWLQTDFAILPLFVDQRCFVRARSLPSPTNINFCTASRTFPTNSLNIHSTSSPHRYI